MADTEQMAETGQEAPAGRRVTTERARRRRRGADSGDTSALAVPEEVTRELASKGLEGRWINDLGNRIYDKTVRDDWDKVPGVEPVPVGTDHRTGQPVMAYYCAKPSELLAEDNKARLAKLEAREKAVFTGRDNGELNEGAYNPKGQNYIGRRAPG